MGFEPGKEFTDFCRSTSLHGWHHLTDSTTTVSHHGNHKRNKAKGGGRFMWFLIVSASIGVASFFLSTSIKDFTSKYVATSIDTTTASLHDVYFPSVIVCNINQIRKSFVRGLGLSNYDEIDLLYRQFYTGLDRNLTKRELNTILSLATSETMVKKLKAHSTMMVKTNTTDIRDIMDNFNWTSYLERNQGYIKSFDFIRDMAVEDPGDSPIISASYGNAEINENATDFLPFFGTDVGLCSIVKPQLSFNSSYDHLTYAQKLFGMDGVSYTRKIKPGAKVGKVNGLVLLLDAETFDYTMNRHVSEGFKITVDHHLDQPLMSMTEMDIAPGFETQVAVTPILYGTTKAAQTRFTPEERGCYFDHELPLTYLPTKWYRYDINNCLFEAAYEKVLNDCKCTPFFHTLGGSKCPRICKGPSTLCMNEIFDQIGEYREVEIGDVGSGTNRTARCLEACEDQQNEVAVTTSKLPNRQTMLKWSDFCVIMEKVEKSCNHPYKRIELDINYPNLCSLLLAKLNGPYFSKFNGDRKDLCKKAFNNFTEFWDVKEFQTDVQENSTDEALLGAMFTYARQNLALVNIYIKPPVVKRIMRDERIPVIWFVANCGGILGLCMGFSIVTCFEVIHYLIRLLLYLFQIPFRQKKNSSNGQNDCPRSCTANTFLEPSTISTIKIDNTELM